MPRLNIYVPDDVYSLAGRWRDTANLSEICANALRDELKALEDAKSGPTLFESLRSRTELEQTLLEKFALADVLVAPSPSNQGELRNALGRAAASYLDRNLADGVQIAVAGGRQLWCVVRDLSPRRLRATIIALGLHHGDPRLLHAHPNTLATLLWLLYAPRSEAHVIENSTATELWAEPPPKKGVPTYFILGSCSNFDPGSPFGQLIGSKVAEHLVKHRAKGDFAYSFFDMDGAPIAVPLLLPHRVLSAQTLKEMSGRNDVRSILVAGGHDKFDAIQRTLAGQLCNVVITDTLTAEMLIDQHQGALS